MASVHDRDNDAAFGKELLVYNRPPLWEVMSDACADHPRGVVDLHSAAVAAEIRALRDRLAAEMLQLATCSCCDVMRARATDWLTAEADRAERGDA